MKAFASRDQKVSIYQKTIMVFKDKNLVLNKHVRQYPRCFPKEIKELVLHNA
jgi:hypothetical protein